MLTNFAIGAREPNPKKSDGVSLSLRKIGLLRGAKSKESMEDMEMSVPEERKSKQRDPNQSLILLTGFYQVFCVFFLSSQGASSRL